MNNVGELKEKLKAVQGHQRSYLYDDVEGKK